jgi:hypothetical protein
MGQPTVSSSTLGVSAKNGTFGTGSSAISSEGSNPADALQTVPKLLRQSACRKLYTSTYFGTFVAAFWHLTRIVLTSHLDVSGSYQRRPLYPLQAMACAVSADRSLTAV